MAKPQMAEVVVVGAGVMGLWTALELRRRGRDVLLADPWGLGHSRSSSGGETRILRATYGANSIYVAWAKQARAAWLEFERECGRQLFLSISVLWLVGEDDSYERAALIELERHAVRYEKLMPDELERRFPQMRLEGIHWGIYEPDGGVILARQACRAVLDSFLEAGGRFILQSAHPVPASSGRLASVQLGDSSEVHAEVYVFACGPWLPEIFPALLGKVIRVTKQDVFFLGTPADDPRFAPPYLPAWVDMSAECFYGVPAVDGRGFKVAPWQETPFDPTAGERIVSPHTLALTRSYLVRRFPAMKDAPVIETRVCQFEMTPDEHFIIDRHPEWENVWILGGGSGHSFKHGPAIGAYAAGHIVGRSSESIEPQFRLARFSKQGD